jgi:2,3-dihydroxybenzoate-AMP ligase
MLAGSIPWPTSLAACYRAAGYWLDQTIGERLHTLADQRGDAIVVTENGVGTSFGELDDRADRLAAGLYRLGIRPTDRVVVQLPGTMAFVELVFALFRLGAIPVMALPPHRSSEIGYFCRFSEAVAYVIPDRHAGFDYRELAAQVQAGAPALRHVIVAGNAGDFIALSDLYDEKIALAEPAADEVALLQLSGGSTGVPKLIPRTHNDYLYTALACARASGTTQDTVYLNVLPIGHNFPLVSPGLLGTLAVGGRTVLAPAPSPDVAFRLIESERATLTSLVPPLALVWLQAAARRTEDLTSLQVVQIGGAKCSAEVASRIRPVLGCTLQQIFGMAEGLINTTRLDDPDEAIINTQGRPISPADEIRIVDDDDNDVPVGTTGHLLARGAYTIRGYYQASQHNAVAFTADGYYRTGDIVRRRPDGNLVVEGRAKDQINRGGEKVAAEEIENHLLAHPAVHDAAVVAMPDAFLGERTCAYVIPSSAQPAAGELASFLRKRGLAGFKIPDRFEYVDEFPQIGVGKISKTELRREIADAMKEKT